MPSKIKLRIKYKLALLYLFLFVGVSVYGGSWIRINQMGYLPHSIKVAVFISDEAQNINSFQVIDAITGKSVYEDKPIVSDGKNWGMKVALRFDFSKLENPGGYYIKAGNAISSKFCISALAYKGTADFILQYMRQQRCGYNPYLHDSCHTHDGYIVDHPTRTGEIVDVKGGWHDAADYLQYVTTSANAVYQMLFAYQQNPEVFRDEYNSNGEKGANGIPDILDEAKWGIDWLLKMNPEKNVMFNQVADDRDHRGFRLPTKDTTSYGFGPYRPVYFLTGKPQGLAKYKNRTTGVSSTAGKFSSAFAIASRLFEKYDKSLADKLKAKAIEAYEFGLADLGNTQTACNVSPYFYEEDNYCDDLELAAFELYKITGKDYYIKQVNYWGPLEPVTPWMEKGAARHYQYYPFVNLGHANMALSEKSPVFAGFMKQGLLDIYQRGKDDPFLNGVPFIWCSNNLLVATITQCRLYLEATHDSTFVEMEASLRDWLFGCNPWGTSMICGLPEWGDSPMFPHSAYTLYKKQTTYGGLVDGPIYKTIFESHIGSSLQNVDIYKPFQQGIAVYHDDIGDYSSNEPTMDGTASISFYLSHLEKEGRIQDNNLTSNGHIDKNGALICLDPSKKTVYLIFSADEYGEGIPQILSILKMKHIKGSFFLTGNFLRNSSLNKYVPLMLKDGHYVGPHSDKHLLYSPWEHGDSLLISREEFENDLKENYKELSDFNIQRSNAYYFLPPYEWANQEISDWAHTMGLQLINLTPGTGTNADYTTPDMKNYKTSRQLIDGLKKYESGSEDGLNGAIILIHPGTDPARTDKLYNHLSEIISTLSKKGYKFGRF